MELNFKTGFVGLQTTINFASKCDSQQVPYKTLNEARVNNPNIKAYNIITNIFRIAEWTPIIGQVIGVARVVFAAYMLISDTGLNSKSYCLGLLARGLVAATGLGIVLMVPDVVASIAYAIHAHTLRPKTA